MNRESWANTSSMDYDPDGEDHGDGQYQYWHPSHIHSSPRRESLSSESQRMSPFAPDPSAYLAHGSQAAGDSQYAGDGTTSPFNVDELANDPIASAPQPEDDDNDDDQKPSARDTKTEKSPHRKRHSLSEDPFLGETGTRLFHEAGDPDPEDDQMTSEYDDTAHVPPLVHHHSPNPMFRSAFLSTNSSAHPGTPIESTGYAMLPLHQPGVPSQTGIPHIYRFGGTPVYPPPPPPPPPPIEPFAALPSGDRKPSPKDLSKIPVKREVTKKKRRPTKRSSQTTTSSGERTSQHQCSPTDEEIFEAKTPRAKKALETWYQRLGDLIDYKEKHGNCSVPQKYSPNAALGIWVNKQRMEYKFYEEGKRSSMTPAKLKALNDMGFTWAKRKGQPSWNRRYNELKEYLARTGSCDVPTKYAASPALGRWVSTQRSQYKQWVRGYKTQMTQERVDRLNEIGFKWNMMERDSPP